MGSSSKFVKLNKCNRFTGCVTQHHGEDRLWHPFCVKAILRVQYKLNSFESISGRTLISTKINFDFKRFFYKVHIRLSWQQTCTICLAKQKRLSQNHVNNHVYVLWLYCLNKYFNFYRLVPFAILLWRWNYFFCGNQEFNRCYFSIVYTII